MTRFRTLVLLLTALLLPVTGGAAPSEDAEAAVNRWVAAFNANDADAVVRLYTPDAILLGTVSPIISEGTVPIGEYFKNLPGSGNKVAIGDHRTVMIGPDAVLVTGFYEFMPIREGKPMPAPARFSMVLLKRGTDWLIAHHHSSRKPEPPK